MKIRLIISLLLAVSLCFYGCESDALEELPDDTTKVESTDEPEENPAEDNPQEDNPSEEVVDYTEEDEEYYQVPGDGTQESPYTVSQALEVLHSGTYDPDMVYYVKGIVSENTGASSSADSGGGYLTNYYINEGGDSLNDTCLFIYKGASLGGEYFTSPDDPKAGDKVIVYGNLIESNEDGPTMTNGVLYYWNGEFGVPYDEEYVVEPNDGTREHPYTVSEALELIDSGAYDPDKGYYVKGIVSRISAKLGMGDGKYLIDYFISDDGNYIKESCLYIFAGFDLGGKYFTSYNYNALSVGDKIIVYGKLSEPDDDVSSFPFMISGKLYYWNGKFGDLDVDEYFMEPGDGTKESPYNVPQVTEMINEGTYDPDKVYYVKGIVILAVTATQYEYGWRISYYFSETGCYVSSVDPEIYVDRGYGLGGKLFSSGDALVGGDYVIVYGKFAEENGKLEILSGKLCYWNGTTADDDDGSGDGDNDDGDDDDGDDDGDDGDDDDDSDNVCIYMTDENFKQYCYTNFDLDNNGKVSFAEADMVTTINCSTAEDFTGIEYFPNLKSFTSGSAKYLDLSHNTELSYIYMANSPIEQLDLSQNENLIYLADYAFYGCTELTSITLPITLLNLGAYAFYNCTSMGKIIFSLLGTNQNPETNSSRAQLTTIGDYAFYSCESLEFLDIPHYVTTIGDYAFYGCSSLTSVNGGDTLSWPNQMIFLRNSVTSLGKYAFSYCTSLPDMDLSETNLTAIEEGTFYQCTSLQYLAFPESLTSIGDSAFLSCTSLTALTGSSYASTKNFSIPEGVILIGNSAFAYCQKLNSITIYSENLKEIGIGAFYNCTRLYTVRLYTPDPPSLGYQAFSQIRSNPSLSVPYKSVNAYKNSDFAEYFYDIRSL